MESVQLKAAIKVSGKLLKGKGPETVQKTLDVFIENAIMFLQTEVKKRTPMGVMGTEGGLISTVLTEVFQKGTPYVKGIVATNSAYAQPVEKGTKAHMPPTEPIRLWVQKKLGIEGEAQAQKIAFAIAMKIKKEGTKGKFMFQKGFDAGLPRLRQMARELGFTIKKELNQ